MKPPSFEYRRPDTLEEALALLEQYGDAAKVLAGGQSLLPLMAFRLARPSVIVDLNRVDGIDDINLQDASLEMGSMTRHRAVERLRQVADRCPMISDAVAEIGHVAIRNRGTVGGSIAHADPAAEWPLLALLLEARFKVQSSRSSREVRAAEMFRGYLETALAPEEMLVRLEFELPPVGAGTGFIEVAARHGDFAMGGAGAILLIADGVITEARVGIMSAALTPVRAREAEAWLVGQEPTDDVFEAASRAVDEAISPLGDVHAPADYKRNLARVTAKRALVRARDRAVGAAT